MLEVHSYVGLGLAIFPNCFYGYGPRRSSFSNASPDERDLAWQSRICEVKPPRVQKSSTLLQWSLGSGAESLGFGTAAWPRRVGGNGCTAVAPGSGSARRHPSPDFEAEDTPYFPTVQKLLQKVSEQQLHPAALHKNVHLARQTSYLLCNLVHTVWPRKS